MAQNSEALITQLVGGLEPVKPLRFSRGIGYILLTAAISTALILSLFGLRPDLQAWQVAPIPLIATGLFLGLGRVDKRLQP